MRPSRALTVLCLSVPLLACQNTGSGSSTPLGGANATIGTLGGAAAGGLIGSTIGGGTGNALATLAGTLAGGLLGNRIGSGFDEPTRQQAAEAERHAVMENRPVAWNSPDRNSSGRVRPNRTFTDGSGRLCREYTTMITVQGRTETGTGTACRQSDGTWSLVNSSA